jgi:non-specific serine/threonine protein kinase
MRGDRERARSCLLESLAMRRHLDDKDGLRWNLHSLSFLALQEGDGARAVRLLGAAARLGEQLGAMLGAERQARYDQHVAGLRAQLGEAGFTARWAEGYVLETESAISGALGL